MSETQHVSCVPKAQFDPSTLTSSYQPMNGTGFQNSIKMLKLYNGSSTISIDISLDGVTDHDFIPTMGTLILDFQTNHRSAPTYGTGTLYMRQDQILWGKIAEQPNWLQMVGYY